MSKLKPEITELSDKLQAALKITKEGLLDDSVKEAVASLYTSNLPGDLTIDTVQAVRNYDTSFVAAGANAVGQAAIPVMTKNKDLQDVTVRFPMTGKDALEVNFNRDGSVQPKLRMYGTKSVGQLGVIKSELKEKAAGLAN